MIASCPYGDSVSGRSATYPRKRVPLSGGQRRKELDDGVIVGARLECRILIGIEKTISDICHYCPRNNKFLSLGAELSEPSVVSAVASVTLVATEAQVGSQHW